MSQPHYNITVTDTNQIYDALEFFDKHHTKNRGILSIYFKHVEVIKLTVLILIA